MKKRIANFIMIAVIMLIAAAGVLVVGNIQGWFDKADGQSAVLSAVRGIVTMERGGVAYDAEAGTVLRQGDRLTASYGATAEIRVGGGYLTMGEKTELSVTEPSADGFAATVTSGEVFACAETPITVSFDRYEAVFFDAVASLSVRSGARSISVYEGTVSCGENQARAGQMLNLIGVDCSVAVCQIGSLNDFLIGQLRTANESRSLCFTNEELDRLVADRQASMQALLTAPTQPEDSGKPTEETEPSSTETQENTAPSAAPTQTPTEATQAASSTETEPSETQPEETEPPAKNTCTISIRCDTILSNMDNLAPGKAEFVPGDGFILYPVTVEFEEGETVFDVLARVCNTYGIQIEYSWTPMYDSYYIEGIGHLYEFDCGSESGWMYKVNGWFPNYGCSAYTLKDGDSIAWCYTCNGLGADIGGYAG